MPSFADELKAERERLGLTQAACAETLEISKSLLEKWERGNHEPLTVAQEGALTRLKKLKTKKQ